jgi:CDP-glucose 4,6-dehydratase
MGAKVSGYALAPATEPNLWALMRLTGVRSVYADINDRAALDRALADARPEVILHLAAQALVRRSYREPLQTFAANVMGVVTLLDAARACPDLKAVVIATSDKAYDNVEQIWGYRETDPMGGRDPYSASKGAAEIAAASMGKSFFAPFAADGHPARVATARAGNVIGGGDWSEDRLVPDIVRGCLGPDSTVTLRAPSSVRPWQHVLEPVRGYLMLAERLAGGDDAAATGWNFGPERRDERAVVEVAEAVVGALGRGRIAVDAGAATLHEAKLLRLDCTKARLELGWVPCLGFDDCIRLTADWYGGWSRGETAIKLCGDQIAEYQQLCEVNE